MARHMLNLGVYGSIPVDNLFEMFYDLKDGGEIRIYQTKSLPSLGAWVYDAAVCLARYLESDFSNQISNETKLQYNLQGKTLLELGAGTGLVGLVSGHYGAKVMITDLEPLLPLIDLNISTNMHLMKAPVSSLPLPWGSEGSICHFMVIPKSFSELMHMPPKFVLKEMIGKVLQSIESHASCKLKNSLSFDLVVLANCIYYESSLDALLETVLSVTKVDSIVLACYEERSTHIKKLIDRWHTMASEHFTIENVQAEASEGTNKYFHEYVRMVIMKPKQEAQNV